MLLDVLSRKKARRYELVRKEAYSRAHKVRLILVDELDALITSKQTLLYNLFDWPCHSNSNLIVLAIANTMDLPERLQQKIASRIGSNRLIYEPYNRLQILEILTSRLGDAMNVFDPRSLDYVARKVSLYSGDIRRSLTIAKKAVESCRDAGQCKKVTYLNVMDAFDELCNSKMAKVIRQLCRNEVIVLLAIHHELNLNRVDKVLMDAVQDRCNQILNQIYHYTCNPMQRQMRTPQFREIVKRLQAFGIVQLQIDRQKIVDDVSVGLAVFTDELINALLKDPVKKFKHLLKQVARYLQPLRLLLEEAENIAF